MNTTVMCHYMKLYFLFTFLILFSCLANCQTNNSFEGNWQYFDNNNNYHELTIEGNDCYLTDIKFGAVKTTISVKDSILKWASGEIWTINKKQKGILYIHTSIKYNFKLYPLLNPSDIVKEFYLWTINPEQTGNGYVIFSKGLNTRKRQLKKLLKNGT